MARRTIKTMNDKMAESGKVLGKNILDDTDLATDPLVNAIQSLRETIDDIQYNDANHGTDKLQSQIDANTAKTGITTSQANAITANTAKTGISSAQATTITALAKGITNSTGQPITIALSREGALVITVDRATYTIAADR